MGDSRADSNGTELDSGAKCSSIMPGGMGLWG